MDNNIKTPTLLINSLLLQYPDSNWFELLPEVEAEVEGIKDKVDIKCISNFLDYVRGTNELDLSELYVNTFDFTKNTTLYLTYYRFKEQRERGTELLRLKQRYFKEGFQMEGNELPDFLPLVLEFTSITGSKDLLMDYIIYIQEICNILSKDSNPYSHVFSSILSYLNSGDNEIKECDSLKVEPNTVTVGGDER